MRRCLWAILVPVVAACADSTEPPLEPPPPSLADRIILNSFEGGELRIYSMALDGTDRRQIPIALRGHLLWPDASPDGRKVAFVHERAIYSVRADGSELRRLTPGPDGDIRRADIRPRWSPDGTELAFSTNRFGGLGELHLYVMGVDGSNLRRLTNEGEVFMGSWSPDGLRLAFTVRDSIGARVGIVRRDGSDRVELPPLTTDGAPDWSPDGLEIAYQSLDELSIHVIAVDGSNDRRITPAGVSDGSPRWSPDGTRIMFLSVMPDHGIAVCRGDGTERRQLTWGNDSEPDWGPAE